MVDANNINTVAQDNEIPKIGAKSKKVRLSVTIPRWVKEEMSKWITCEQFPSDSEFTGIALAYFIFMLKNNQVGEVNINEIKKLQRQLEDIQQTLDVIAKNKK